MIGNSTAEEESRASRMRHQERRATCIKHHIEHRSWERYKTKTRHLLQKAGGCGFPAPGKPNTHKETESQLLTSSKGQNWSGIRSARTARRELWDDELMRRQRGGNGSRYRTNVEKNTSRQEKPCKTIKAICSKVNREKGRRRGGKVLIRNPKKRRGNRAGKIV